MLKKKQVIDVSGVARYFEKLFVVDGVKIGDVVGAIKVSNYMQASKVMSKRRQAYHHDALVTGHKGFIGQNVYNFLKVMGKDPIGVDIRNAGLSWKTSISGTR